MATTTTNESPMIMELASQMVSQIESFFGKVTVSKSHSIEGFPREDTGNYLYVLYSANGMPLHVGVMLNSTNKREQNRTNKEIQGFGASGYVSTYRLVEFGSEEIAREMERLVKDLFSDALPLRTSGQSQPGSEATPQTETTIAAPSTGRRRGRPPGTGRRRGRPRKADASTSAETPIQRGRRGRPKKSEQGSQEETTKRRPGRPKKADSATLASGGTKKRRGRRGRPRKSEAASTDTSAAPARRGRRRSTETAATNAGGVAATGGRGRKAAAGKAPARKRRRGRKAAKATSTPTGNGTAARGRRGRKSTASTEAATPTQEA